MSYNTSETDLDTAREVAVAYIEAGMIPVLIGPPGAGKTATAAAIAADLGAELRPIRLNNIAPEAAAGLQYVDRDGRRSIHLPPAWLPNPDGTDGPVLVFIDEINQASDENRKAIMSALLERYLGDTKVAANCWFMAAGNSADDGTNVYEFDRATADRLGFILIRPDVESWCNDYAPAHDVDVGLVAFLRIRPDAFEMSQEMMKGEDVIGPSPRTWEAIDRFLKIARKRGMSAKAVDIGLKGKLGGSVGTAFSQVWGQTQQMRSIEEMLAMPPRKRLEHMPKTLEALWVYAQGMIWYATSLERMRQVFELLDSFEEVDDVPFYETRFSVSEMMLQRSARHGIDQAAMFTDERMVALMRKWRAEMNGIAATAEPVANEDDAGVDGVAFGRAA